MAYYTALQTAWALSSATPGALPSGVAGTSLNGLSTTAKLAALNAWTVTGTIPAALTVTGTQVANCINWGEFATLTAQQQSNLLALLQIPGGLLSGSAELSQLLPGMLVAYFNVAGPTITALTALAAAQVQPWWSVSVANGGGGLTSTVSQNDLTAAGGLS